MKGCQRCLAVLVAAVVTGCQPAVSPSPPSASPPTTTPPSPSSSVTAPPTPAAALWHDVTAEAIGQTAEWTNKVEVADLDADGRPDLLFANGGLYEAPGDPEPARVFRNEGGGRFAEVTEDIFGSERFLSRAIKVADADFDGQPDIVVSGTFQTPTRFFRGLGGGRFEPDFDRVPDTPLSIGDLEFGDVDNDHSLDLVLVDWGAGSPMSNAGGRVRLWRNTSGGQAPFEDVTDAAMPDVLVRFSWDLELLDIDGDWDLDLAISCKQCAGSFLFENDGSGRFTDVTAGRMPPSPNNYDFEAMDMDGDGDLDLVTINDGGIGLPSLSERVLLNDGAGKFTDATADLWPPSANVGFDDNMVAFLDVESDGDADFVVGSLDGEDRLLVNDGRGHLSLQRGIIDTTTPSGGTLGIALADIDGDGRMDLVEGQGEVAGHENERVYLGTGLDPDTAPPVVSAVVAIPVEAGALIYARVHDRKSPSRPHDWRSVEVRSTYQGARLDPAPMQWYGEYLWWTVVEPGSGPMTYEVCATDAAGNRACAAPDSVVNG